MFFLRGVYEVSQSATNTARAILQLREQHRQATAELGASGGTAARLLDYLFEQPIVSIRMVEKKLGCAYVTAGKLIDQFVKSGLLKEITGQQRNRRYRYGPYLALFESPTAVD